MLFLAISPPFVLAQSAPVLFFSDLDWGPKTGWEGSATRGAAVTVWGLGFGTSRGSSYITINGAQITSDSDYAEWGVIGPARGLQRITFWVPSAAADGAGTISVTVNGVTSNALPFTVTAGTIYFISPTGSNSNNGLYATSQGGSNGPFRDIYMFNPGLDGFHTPANRNPSGDGQYIVYVRSGTYTTLDADNSFVTLRGPYGGPARRKALIGYPGEMPTLQNVNANRGVAYNANYAPYGRNSYFTYAKLRAYTGYIGPGTWGEYNRVIGNIFEDMRENAWAGVVMVDNSQYTSIYGNLFDNCGYDSYKHNIYIKTHPDYVAGDKSADYTYVGWNEFADAYSGADDRGGVIFVSRAGGTAGKYTNNTFIHDNYFHDGDMDFVYIGDSVDIGDVFIYNNILRGGTSTNGGITLYAGTNNVYLYNNVFYQIGPANRPMIWGTELAHAYFKNNIWYSHPGQAFYNLETWRGATFNYDYDLFYDPDGSTSIPSGYGITAANCIAADPHFSDISSYDFHLQPGSPAIDAGTSSVSSLLGQDYEGVPRPRGAGYDIGTYEYSSGPCTPSCTGKHCGNDGCGGSCGTCTGGYTCNSQGQCIPPDTSPPAITFVSPTPSNNTNVTGNYVQVNVSITEAPAACILNWYSGSWANYSMAVQAMSCYRNMTGLANGTYQFRVYANDTLGNMNASAMRQNGVSYPGSAPPACAVRADMSPCDGCVNTTELNLFIQRWQMNNQDVTLRELIEAIGLWKFGASCALAPCPGGQQITSSCVCEGSTRTTGYCCIGSDYETLGPCCPNGPIPPSGCYCSAQYGIRYDNYCCDNFWSSGPC